MDEKNKDKVIIGLIIAVVLLFANTIVDKNNNDFEANKISLLESNDEIIVKSDELEAGNGPLYIPDEIVKVHISGEIMRPGVYTISDGDRLDDLVKKAGGLTEIADENAINLAMKLSDQMKIYIPSIYEESPIDSQMVTLIGPSTSESDQTKININTASKEELMTLPNIGEKRAQAIIDYREATTFTSIEEIKNVTGIGEKFYQAMKELITV